MWYNKSMTNEKWDQFKNMLENDNRDHGCWIFTQLSSDFEMVWTMDSMTGFDILVKYDKCGEMVYLDKQFVDNELQEGIQGYELYQKYDEIRK